MPRDIEEKGGAFSDVRAGGKRRRKAAERLVQSSGELAAAQDPMGYILGALPVAGEAIGTVVGGPAGGKVGKAIGSGVAEVGMFAEDRPERKQQYREQMEQVGAVTDMGSALLKKKPKNQVDEATKVVEDLGMDIIGSLY